MPGEPCRPAGAGRSRRRTPTYSDTGIVLRSHKLGEADKIIRVMTREHGKRSAVAKGLRKTTSRFGARLEPLSCVKMLAHRGRSLDVIRQVEIEQSFHEVRENLDLFVCGSAMAELVDSITQEHEPHPELFDLMFEGLTLLRREPSRSMSVLVFFEFRVMAAAGFELRVRACACCGGPTGSGGASFSLDLGGLVCETCRGDRASLVGRLVRISPAAARRLEWMAGMEGGQWQAGEPDGSVERELRLLMDRVLEHWMEREFRTHRVMKRIPAGSNTAAGKGKTDGS